MRMLLIKCVLKGHLPDGLAYIEAKRKVSLCWKFSEL